MPGGDVANRACLTDVITQRGLLQGWRDVALTSLLSGVALHTQVTAPPLLNAAEDNKSPDETWSTFARQTSGEAAQAFHTIFTEDGQRSDMVVVINATVFTLGAKRALDLYRTAWLDFISAELPLLLSQKDTASDARTKTYDKVEQAEYLRRYLSKILQSHLDALDHLTLPNKEELFESVYFSPLLEFARSTSEEHLLAVLSEQRMIVAEQRAWNGRPKSVLRTGDKLPLSARGLLSSISSPHVASYQSSYQDETSRRFYPREVVAVGKAHVDLLLCPDTQLHLLQEFIQKSIDECVLYKLPASLLPQLIADASYVANRLQTEKWLTPILRASATFYCRTIDTYILHDDSRDYSSPKEFWSNKRCSFPSEYWSRFVIGLAVDLSALCPLDVAREVLLYILEHSLTSLLSYLKLVVKNGNVQERRLKQFDFDIGIFLGSSRRVAQLLSVTVADFTAGWCEDLRQELASLQLQPQSVQLFSELHSSQVMALHLLLIGPVYRPTTLTHALLTARAALPTLLLCHGDKLSNAPPDWSAALLSLMLLYSREYSNTLVLCAEPFMQQRGVEATDVLVAWLCGIIESQFTGFFQFVEDLDVFSPVSLRPDNYPENDDEVKVRLAVINFLYAGDLDNIPTGLKLLLTSRVFSETTGLSNTCQVYAQMLRRRFSANTSPFISSLLNSLLVILTGKHRDWGKTTALQPLLIEMGSTVKRFVSAWRKPPAVKDANLPDLVPNSLTDALLLGQADYLSRLEPEAGQIVWSVIRDNKEWLVAQLGVNLSVAELTNLPEFWMVPKNGVVTKKS